jgi:hypothetical protein
MRNLAIRQLGPIATRKKMILLTWNHGKLKILAYNSKKKQKELANLAA